MIEKQIIKLLKKISVQLEDISAVQEKIRAEILRLHEELGEFHASTLKNLEDSLFKSPPDSLLN